MPDFPWGSEDESDLPPVPARMLNELAYCPRLFHLEWVQAEWAPNADTAAGLRQHASQDKPRGRVPASPQEDPAQAEQDFSATAVWMTAPRLGLTAKIDLLEGENGQVQPIEYKRGKGPPEPGPWEPDEIQIGAQMLVLRENGYKVEQGIVAYRDAKRREYVVLEDVLEMRVLALRDRARALAEQPTAPAPLIDSPKCPRCSLVSICLPDETNVLSQAGPGHREPEPESDVELDPEAETSASQGPQARRLIAPSIDSQPLVVQTAGTRIGRRDERLVVHPREGRPVEVRLLETSEVCLFGGVQISTQALSACFRAEIPVAFFSAAGWFQGYASAPGGRNAQRRLDQYSLVSDDKRCLDAARALVRRKVRNSRTLLRRNARTDVASCLAELERISKKVLDAPDTPSLLGLEGLAAKAYFGSFSAMFADQSTSFEFTKRNRRPPADPVNALLSLAYSLLTKDWTAALHAVGLDPYVGVFHRPKHGKPALALDLMEEFRPLIADSVVLQVLNNGEIEPHHFVQRGPACNLNDHARGKFLDAYSRRMEQEVRHPVLGYSVSYRRLLLVQARLFTRFCAGEIPEYPGFQTR